MRANERPPALPELTKAAGRKLRLPTCVLVRTQKSSVRQSLQLLRDRYRSRILQPRPAPGPYIPPHCRSRNCRFLPCISSLRSPYSLSGSTLEETWTIFRSVPVTHICFVAFRVRRSFVSIFLALNVLRAIPHSLPKGPDAERQVGKYQQIGGPTVRPRHRRAAQTCCVPHSSRGSNSSSTRGTPSTSVR
jgi:hypothetical protein